MSVVLLASCTTPRKADAPAARVKDSPAEKVAAQNDADRDLEAEGNERRWGFDQARQRAADAKAKAGASSSSKSREPGTEGSTLSGPRDSRAPVGPKNPAPATSPGTSGTH